MATHWTYSDIEDADDLVQGDILDRTDELADLIRNVHAHFCDEKYLGFLVVTNTCDLVSRGTNPCKVQYITLAVVRALEALIPSLLSDVCPTPIPKVYNKESKDKASQLLQRILNQNEQSLGLFYLHPDVDSGISEMSVALLRVKISFRAEHYKVLKAARVGRVSPTFSSKLGWLAGNLYSRVATPDWSDHEGGKKEQKQVISTLLEPAVGVWISGKQIKNASKAGVDISSLTSANAENELLAYVPESQKKIVLKAIEKQATKVFSEETPETIRKLVDRVRNDTSFQDALK